MGQTFPFTSGPIPMCDTSTFTANVAGVGWLIVPDGWNWGPYLESVLINITSNHPQTLSISLTSPAGTTVLLSAFNGAGGQNYTNTEFFDWAWMDITTGTAPFTGDFRPQGGFLGDFAGENADGTWTITVVDTACVNGGTGPGGTWIPGWFSGGTGSGAFSFGFSSPPPPCIVDMGYQTTYLCPGETVDMQAYYMSNWDNGNGLVFDYYLNGWIAVPDPSAVSEPGSYTVNGWDWAGCSYYGTYDIVAASALDLGPDQVVQHCTGAGTLDLHSLFDLASASTIDWSLDGVAITAAAAAAATTPGVYGLTATSQGCTDQAQVTLTIVTSPSLGADQFVSICPGGEADLGVLYTTTGLTTEWWFGGAVIPMPVAATDAGDYTLVATNAGGCADTTVVTLDVQALASLGADQSAQMCSNALFDLTTLYTTTGLPSAWTLSDVPVSDPTTVSAAGTYRLVVSNGSGCADTAFVVLDVIATPVLGSNTSVSICSGDPVDLTSYYNTVGLTTAWTTSGSAVSDPSAVTASGLYALTASNADGCSASVTVDLTVAPNPVLGADQDVVECFGVPVDLTALYATGANTTAWSLNGAPVDDPTSVTDAGTYTLTATTSAGCEASAVVTLSLVPSPDMGADQQVQICSGSTFDLSTVFYSTGFSEVWTLNGASVADPLSVAVTGNYRLVVANAAGCSDTAFVQLTVNDGPALGGDLSFALCPWQSVDLPAVFPVGDASASYTLNGEDVADPTVVTDAGVYVVTVIDANGCSDQATATVMNVECMCVADFDVEGRCMQDPMRFTLVADSVVLAAQWLFGDAAPATTVIDPTVMFRSEEDVRVTLRATLSCGVVDVERMIRIEDCSDSCTVWIPNAFTPNNDTWNDSWTWSGECEPEDFSVEVFDRWGELVFASKDPEKSWDGTFGGTALPSGVFAYRVGYRLPYQDRTEMTGSITLVR